MPLALLEIMGHLCRPQNWPHPWRSSKSRICELKSPRFLLWWAYELHDFITDFITLSCRSSVTVRVGVGDEARSDKTRRSATPRRGVRHRPAPGPPRGVTSHVHAQLAARRTCRLSRARM